MNILVIDNGSKHTLKLHSLLQEHNVKILRHRRNTRIDLEWADLFVLTGSNIPAFLHGYYKKELDLIKTTHKPILGICLGFELIALAYGERIVRGQKLKSYISKIFVRPELLGSEDKTSYEVFEAHRWVLESAENLEVLGESNRGIEIIKHPVKKIIGLQFHPEVTEPSNEGADIFRKSIHYLLTQ